MSNYFGKQPSSRIIASQGTAISTAGANASVAIANKFGPQTYQVGVASDLPVWFTYGDGAQTAAQGTGARIAANVPVQYFAVTPGQQGALLSTSTSTGFFCLIEMA